MSESTSPTYADYLKAAAFNQYNLIGSGGLLTFAVMSGSLLILMPIWMGLEMVLLWTLSTNPGFQRRVDADFESAAQLRSEKVLTELPASYTKRYMALKDTFTEVRKSARSAASQNDMISIWQPEIDKLGYVLSSFLRLSQYLASLDAMLARTNKNTLRSDLNNVARKMQNCSENLRYQYQRYVDILQQRLEKTEKAFEIAEAIRVQLNIIEEQFKLIQQQVYLVKNPQELTDQLDFLVSGINDLEDQGTMILSLQAELAKLTPAVPD